MQSDLWRKTTDGELLDAGAGHASPCGWRRLPLTAHRWPRPASPSAGCVGTRCGAGPRGDRRCPFPLQLIQRITVPLKVRSAAGPRSPGREISGKSLSLACAWEADGSSSLFNDEVYVWIAALTVKTNEGYIEPAALAEERELHFVALSDVPGE